MQKKNLKKQMIFQVPQLKSPAAYAIFACLLIYISCGLWGRDPWRQADLIYFIKFQQLYDLSFFEIWQIFTTADFKSFKFFNNDTPHFVILAQTLLLKSIGFIFTGLNININTTTLLRLFFVANIFVFIFVLQKSQKKIASLPEFQLLTHPFHPPEQKKLWQQRYEKLIQILPLTILPAAMGSALYLHEGTEEMSVLALFSALLFFHLKVFYATSIQEKLWYSIGYGLIFFLFSNISISFLLLMFFLEIAILIQIVFTLILNQPYHSPVLSQYNKPKKWVQTYIYQFKLFDIYLHFFLLFFVLLIGFAEIKPDYLYQPISISNKILSYLFKNTIRLNEWLKEFPAFSWPLLPLAIYGFFQRPRDLLFYMLSIIAVSLVYILTPNFSRQILVLSLPSLIILASWGLILLPNAWHKMLVNLGHFLFSSLGLALILILIAWQNPIHAFYFWPELEFVNQHVSLMDYITLLMILILITVAYYYIKKYQKSIIYAPLIWALGLLSCWMIFIFLYLPAINQIKTYREVIKTLGLYIPKNSCVGIDRLNISQEAALHYFSKLKITKNQIECNFLIQGKENVKKNIKTDIHSEKNKLSNQWQLIWQGNRLMSKDEIFTLYHKIDDRISLKNPTR